MTNHLIWQSVLADLFVNLSAGWFGAVFVLPIALQKSRQISLKLLTINLVLAIFSLVIAFQLKKTASL